MREYKGQEGRLTVADDGDITIHFEGFMAGSKKGQTRVIPRANVFRAEVVPSKGLTPAYFRVHQSGGAGDEKFKPNKDLDTLVLKSPAQAESLIALAAELSGQIVAAPVETVARVTTQTPPPPPPPAAPAQSSLVHGNGIAAAKAKMGSTFGAGREIDNLHQHLLAGEVVQRMASGRYEGDLGLVVLTSHRLLVVFHGIMRQRLEDFPLDKISSVQVKTGMLGGEITVHASGNKATIDRVEKATAQAIADAIRARINGISSAAPAAPVAAAPAASAMEEMKRLTEMKEAGFVTDAEFSDAKAKLLARL